MHVTLYTERRLLVWHRHIHWPYAEKTIFYFHGRNTSSTTEQVIKRQTWQITRFICIVCAEFTSSLPCVRRMDFRVQRLLRVELHGTAWQPQHAENGRHHWSHLWVDRLSVPPISTRHCITALLYHFVAHFTFWIIRSCICLMEHNMLNFFFLSCAHGVDMGMSTLIWTRKIKHCRRSVVLLWFLDKTYIVEQPPIHRCHNVTSMCDVG